MVGVMHREIAYTPFEKAAKHHLEVSPYLMVIAAGTHPRRLKRVGWSLVGANLVTLGLLLVSR